MHHRFFDMVEYAVSRGLGEIHISIDGVTPETYERIRVRARFDQVISNVEGLVAARRRLGAATPRILAERLVFISQNRNRRRPKRRPTGPPCGT
jgi:hypothetical protein